MEIRYTTAALRDLKALPSGPRRRIRDKLELYARAPSALAGQVRRLQGWDRALRLRVGNYRVIFTEDGIVLQVLRVAHRRDVYR